MTLQPKAHLLYNHSLQILSSLENMENEMYEDRVENISFGCSVTMAQVFLPQLLKKLKMIYPTIHFHIIVNNLEYIENLLLKNELDFALIETTPLHQLKKMAFYQDELVIVVHQKHPLLKVKDLKELEHYDYYSREKGSSIYELVHSYFISHDLDIVPTIECTNPHALIELVKQNDGFSILPYSLVKESKEITYLKNNDFQIQRTYHIVMHKDKKLLPLYQEFEVLYEFVEKLPHILKPGGRVAILTFHSGEDRIVKKTFKEMKNSGVYEDVCRNVIRPTKEECHRNSRAKSTKMRWAIKAK